MKLRALFGIIISLNAIFSFGQDCKIETDNKSNVCRILRYVTDVQSVSESTKSISVNMLFLLSSDQELGDFVYSMPDANKVKVVNYSVKVYDGNGTLVFKQRKKKPSLQEFKVFNPVLIASNYFTHPKPISVEWDFKLIAYGFNDDFKWPSINNKCLKADEASLRINFDSKEEFEHTSNMIVEEERDPVSGRFFYLWSIKKLTPEGGEFNGEKVSSPYVNVKFK